MTNIMNVILDPQITESIIEPIKSSIQLAQQLKAAGHAVYIFANAPHELYSAIKKKYPDIITIFDGVVISSQVKTVKPDPAMFNHLISTHNLDPQDCILIDYIAENTTVAQKMGMQAIVCDKASHMKKQLKKCGVKV